MLRFDRRHLIAVSALTLLSAFPAQPQTYPDRPIRVVLPYTAGGVSDQIMRLLAPRMEERLGQRLVIEAKPGAAGNIGTLDVAKSESDGYTILVAATNNYVINQFTMKMPIDPLAALTPVAKLADVPLVLFSNPSVPVKNFAEFLDYARRSPGKLNYGSPAAGTVNHLLLERVKQAAGIDMLHVPYRGSPQGVLALLSNDIQLFTVGLAAGAAHLKEGKLTALAVATERRLPSLPDVPTMIESGLPGFTGANWWGMSVPKGTPDAAIRRINEAVAEALKDAMVVARFATMGLLVPKETPAQFAAGLKAEAELWSEIVRRGKITIE
jgi:tripartite-type tricarboxylate transporter receptor subunit TctC